MYGDQGMYKTSLLKRFLSLKKNKYFYWGGNFFVLLILALADIRVMRFSGYEAFAVFFYSLAISAPLLFLPKTMNRIYSITVIPLFVFISFFYLWIRYFYQIKIDETFIAILATSSLNESKSFVWAELKTLHGLIAINAIMAIGILVLFSLIIKLKFDRTMRVTGVFFLIPFLVISTYFAINNLPEKILMSSAVTRLCLVVQEYKSNLIFYAQAANAPKFPSGLKRESPKNMIGIIVIGESATRKHHSLYGYYRDTSPFMQKEFENKNLFVFNNVFSSAKQTTISLSHIFTFSTLQSRNPMCNFEAIARESGFKTILLESFDRWHANATETATDLIFKNASRKFYLGNRISDSIFDGALIPILQEELAKISASESAVIFVHLLGSHMPFAERYPASFNKFKDGKTNIENIINEYDNSILYTDYILYSILNELKVRNRPSFLLYFSDHGEAVYTGMKRWLVRDEVPACYEIPLFVWLSSNYCKYRPGFSEKLNNNRNTPHVTDHLIYGMLDLCGISYDDFPYERDIFSEHYAPRGL